jgi:hypothetical protein
MTTTDRPDRKAPTMNTDTNAVPFRPTTEDYQSAAIYARVLGSNSGSYVTIPSDWPADRVEEITARVARVNGTWRVAECCTAKTSPCFECAELFASLNTPAA